MIANDVSNRVDVVKWKNDVSEVVPLDLDALRLVLRAAEYGQESRQDFGIEDEYIDEWNETESAIAKIEKLLK